MKIVFVILHYLVAEVTIECIDSIRELDKNNNDISIVVVDNNSPNDSYDILKNYTQLFEDVTLIKNNENLGFAKGNNIGFSYAKNTLNADFIVLINNDTTIEQKNFCEVLIKKYYENKYHVLGPDIITADGYHQNPGKKQSWSYSELKLDRLKKRIRLIMNFIGIDNSFDKPVGDVYDKNLVNCDVKNTILHGACMIMSPDYIKKFDGLCDKTFFYMEEDVLKLMADYYGLLNMYSPDLSIHHKECVSTKKMATNDRNRRKQLYKNLIDASLVYESIKREFDSK